MKIPMNKIIISFLLVINNTVVIAKIVHKRKAAKLPVIVNASILKIKKGQIIYFIWTKTSFIIFYNFIMILNSQSFLLFFLPHKFIYYFCVALNYFDYLNRYICINVI